LRPVHLREDDVDLRLGVVILHPVLPGLSQLNGGDALFEVSPDIVLEELLHLGLSKDSLHVEQQLESLFIGDFREGVVGVVTLEDGVETGVGVGGAVRFREVEVVHGSPERSVSELSLDQSEVFTVDLSTHVAFDEDGETFV
jgi:hypothetical protein